MIIPIFMLLELYLNIIDQIDFLEIDSSFIFFYYISYPQ